jgi:hypothetical protein
MFKTTRYIQNSFAITFPRYLQIRRRANDFEDFFKEHFSGHYGQPQVISVPDELDPEVPRMIFSSKHGFSQILISQIGMTLNVTYSPEWQIDISKGKNYLDERTLAIYQLHDLLDGLPLLFSGLTSKVRIPMSVTEAEIIGHIQKHFIHGLKDRNIYDINMKVTKVINENYFSNLTIQNYRSWKLVNGNGIPSLPINKADEKGIEIIGDFNDRYSYNEKKEYRSSKETSKSIIEKGLREVKKITEMLLEHK